MLPGHTPVAWVVSSNSPLIHSMMWFSNTLTLHPVPSSSFHITELRIWMGEQEELRLGLLLMDISFSFSANKGEEAHSMIVNDIEMSCSIELVVCYTSEYQQPTVL